MKIYIKNQLVTEEDFFLARKVAATLTFLLRCLVLPVFATFLDKHMARLPGQMTRSYSGLLAKKMTDQGHRVVSAIIKTPNVADSGGTLKGFLKLLLLVKSTGNTAIVACRLHATYGQATPAVDGDDVKTLCLASDFTFNTLYSMLTVEYVDGKPYYGVMCLTAQEHAKIISMAKKSLLVSDLAQYKGQEYWAKMALADRHVENSGTISFSSKVPAKQATSLKGLGPILAREMMQRFGSSLNLLALQSLDARQQQQWTGRSKDFLRGKKEMYLEQLPKVVDILCLQGMKKAADQLELGSFLDIKTHLTLNLKVTERQDRAENADSTIAIQVIDSDDWHHVTKRKHKERHAKVGDMICVKIENQGTEFTAGGFCKSSPLTHLPQGEITVKARIEETVRLLMKKGDIYSNQLRKFGCKGTNSFDVLSDLGWDPEVLRRKVIVPMVEDTEDDTVVMDETESRSRTYSVAEQR